MGNSLYPRDEGRYSPFTISVDQREQLPYLFDNIANKNGDPIFVWRKDATLQSGDYSIEGCEDIIAVERKSHDDFLGSIGKGRDRFEREFERLQAMEYAAIVIEAEYTDLLVKGSKYSQIKPKMISQTIISWTMKYPTVHWFLCMDRQHAETTTYRIFEKFWDSKLTN